MRSEKEVKDRIKELEDLTKDPDTGKRMNTPIWMKVNKPSC